MIRLSVLVFLSGFSLCFSDDLVIDETPIIPPKAEMTTSKPEEEILETVQEEIKEIKKAQKETSEKESDIFSIKTATLFAGFYQDGIKNYQVNSEGDRNVFSLAPSIGMNIALRLPNNLLLIPEFIYTKMPTEDSSIQKNLYTLRLDAAYDFNLTTLEFSDGKINNFDLRLRIGTSLMIQTIGSEGGERQIRNGAGTSTFYSPNKKNVSLNNTLDLGLDFTLFSNFEIKLSSYTYQLFNNDKRSFSFGSYFGYRFQL